MAEIEGINSNAAGNSPLDVGDIINAVSNSKDASGNDPNVLQGLTKKQQDLTDLLSGFSKDVLNELKKFTNPKNKDNPFKTFLGDTKTSISKLFGSLNGDTENQDKKDKTGDLGEEVGSLLGIGKIKNKLRPTPQDVLKLDASSSMGALLLYWKLDEFEQYEKDKEKNNNNGGDGGKGGIFNKIFGNLGKGVGGLLALGAALVLFAGALLIFSTIGLDKFGSILIYTGMFVGFVWAMYSVAKAMENIKAEETFFKFGLTMLMLTGALLIFGLAIFIMAKVKDDILDAIPGLLAATVFIVGMSFLSKVVSSEKTDFLNFAIGCAILTVSLLIFAGAIWAMNKILPSIPGALIGLVFATGFIVGMAFLSKLTKDSAQDFLTFSLAVAVLCVGLILFAGAIWIMNAILTPAKVFAAIGVLASAVIMLGVVAIIGTVAQSFKAQFLTALAAFSLLSLILIVISIAVKAAGSISLGELGMAALVLVGATVLMFAAAGLGMLLVSIGAGLFVGLIAASAAFLLFQVVAVSAGIGIAALKKLKLTPEDVKSVAGVFGWLSILCFAIVGAAASMIVSSALLAVMAPHLIFSLAIMASIIIPLSLLTKAIATIPNLNEEDIKLKALTAFSVLGAFCTAWKKNMQDSDIDFNGMAKKMKNIGKITSPMLDLVSLTNELDKLKVQNDIVEKVDILSGVLLSLDNLKAPDSGLSKKMKNVEPIVNSMRSLIQLTNDLEDVTVENIASAQIGLSQLGLLIADPDENKWSFNKIFNSISGVSKGQALALSSASSLADAMKKMMEVVTSVQTLNDINWETTSINIDNLGFVYTYLNNNVFKKLAKVDNNLNQKTESIITSTKKLIEGKPLLAQLSGLNFENLNITFKSFNKLPSIKKDKIEDFESLSKAMGNFNVSAVNNVGTSLERIQNLDLNTSLKPLLQLAEKTKDFEKISKALEAISNSSNKINPSIFNLNNLNGGKVSGDITNKAQNSGKDEGTETLKDIKDILEDWFEASTGSKPGETQFSSLVGQNGSNSSTNPNNLVNQAGMPTKNIFSKAWGNLTSLFS
jgi:hypothetical protein